MTNKPNEGQKVTGEVDVQKIKAELGIHDREALLVVAATYIAAARDLAAQRDAALSALPPKPVQDVLRQCVEALETLVDAIPDHIGYRPEREAAIAALTAAREQLKEGV